MCNSCMNSQKKPVFDLLNEHGFTYYRGVKVSGSLFNSDPQLVKDEIDDILRGSGMDYYEGHHKKPEVSQVHNE